MLILVMDVPVHHDQANLYNDIDKLYVHFHVSNQNANLNMKLKEFFFTIKNTFLILRFLT